MEKTKRSVWIPILIGGGVLVIVCIGAVLVGGGAAYFFSDKEISLNLSNEKSVQEKVELTVRPTRIKTATKIPAVTKPATLTPIPTDEPVNVPTDEPASVPTEKPASLPLEEPTAESLVVVEPSVDNTPTQKEPASKPALTGEQRKDNKYIFDDFSSDAMGWSQDKDEYVNLGIEDQEYSIHVLKPDDLEWVYFPVEFIPYEITFDIKEPPDQKNGSFGVYCQYLDENNKYYIEFNLSTKEYVITEMMDGKLIPLTKENSKGQYWQPARNLNSPATTKNHIGISCYLDSISLFINNKLVDQVDVSKPLGEPGEGAFYVYTFPYADKNGYTVILDNVEIYQPVQ
jgi:hypothetical protein